MGKDRILLVDNDQAHVSLFTELLGKAFAVITASNAEVGRTRLSDGCEFALAFVELRLSGADLLAHLKDASPNTVRIMLTTDGKVDVEAINLVQPFRILQKPCTRQTLLVAVRDGIEDYHRNIFDTRRPGISASRTWCVMLPDLFPGMVLQEDMLDNSGRVLLCKGQRITEWHIARLHQMGYVGSVQEPFRVKCEKELKSTLVLADDNTKQTALGAGGSGDCGAGAVPLQTAGAT